MRYINYLLQVFFVRLTRHQIHVIDKMNVTEASMCLDGSIGIGGNILASHYEQWYSIQYWILPFTGWNTEFKYIGKSSPKYLKITTPKIVTSC